jgi:threonine dehydratase
MVQPRGNANHHIPGVSENPWDVTSIGDAHDRIRPYIHRTPVITCRALDDVSGARLFFKCENLQKAGAFKSRGACNAVFSLEAAEAERGVVTHSSGNHAAALARAAALRGVPAYIVMPSNAPAVKVAAVKHYGGQITFCEATLAARESTAETVLRETGGTMIHPYNDERIIAGQGTAAVEFLEEVPELDVIMAPVGGGGLLAGTAIAAKSLKPELSVVAGEPQLAADAFRGLQAGEIIPVGPTNTIADGLKTSLGEKTFAVIRRLVDAIYLASEAGIARALELTLTRAKTVIEPSSAVPLAAILENPVPFAGKRVGIILSGGNLDLSQLPRILELKA